MLKKGIQFRFEVIPGSVGVYPIPHFGAVAFSTVVFWQRRTGEPETKVGTHKEVTVWEQRDGKWIVARHIAYAHEPGTQSDRVTHYLSDFGVKQRRSQGELESRPAVVLLTICGVIGKYQPHRARFTGKSEVIGVARIVSGWPTIRPLKAPKPSLMTFSSKTFRVLK